MFLSERQFKARKRMTRGIGSFIIGIDTEIDWSCLAVDGAYLGPLCLVLICMVKSWAGLLEVSACERISATQAYLEGGFLLKTLTWLLAILSYATMTFSLPLMIKYPP